MRFYIIILFLIISFNFSAKAKVYTKEFSGWKFTYEVNDKVQHERKLKIESKHYNEDYTVGVFNGIYPLFIKKFPLELGGYDGAVSPVNENEYIDGPDIFVKDLDIPTFKLEGKDGKYFGLYEYWAGASGGGGYSIKFVNTDNGEHTFFNQDANGELFILKDEQNEILGFIHYYFDRILGWYGDYPDEITLWGNLSSKEETNKKHFILKNHLEKELDVIKPFTKEDIEYLSEYQNSLTCNKYECWGTIMPIDYYSEERKKAFRILQSFIYKALYENKYKKKLIPNEFSFMNMVVLETINYDSIDLTRVHKDFRNGVLKDISHYSEDSDICIYATANIIKNNKWIKIWETHPDYKDYVKKAKDLGLSCGTG